MRKFYKIPKFPQKNYITYRQTVCFYEPKKSE